MRDSNPEPPDFAAKGTFVSLAGDEKRPQLARNAHQGQRRRLGHLCSNLERNDQRKAWSSRYVWLFDAHG